MYVSRNRSPLIRLCPFPPPRSYAWKNPEFSKMGEALFYRYHLDDSNRPYEHRIVDVADPSVSGPILKQILQKVRGRPARHSAPEPSL